MPGVTLWMTRSDGEAGVIEARHARAHEARRHDPGTRAEVVVRAPGLHLGWTGPSHYPIDVIEEPDHCAIVEGWITSAEEQTIRRAVSDVVARLLAGNDEEMCEAVRGFQSEMRGDYVVAAAKRDGSRAAVFTDPLGRLPIYSHSDEHSLVVSREPGFAAAVREGIEPDRLGIAQLVWLGYPLGRRTLLEGVRALPMGAVVRATREAEAIRVHERSLYRLDLSPGDGVRDIAHAAERLVELFIEGCREIARHPGFAPGVLSLSGGQDSRAVAGGMIQAGASLVMVTQHEPRAANDEAIALRVAETLGLECRPIPVPGNDPVLRRRLARWKDGLNTVGAARLLPYIDEIARRHGSTACYLTGEGGDKVFPDLARVGSRARPDALAAAVERHNARLDAGVIERWLGLEEGCLRDSLRERLADYPEADPGDRYAHFLVAERARRRLFDAEDRVRFRLWPATPFYQLPFFEQAIAVPRRWKRDYRLFARFQERLSPALSAIPDASTPWPIGSLRFRWRRRLAGTLSLAPAGVQRAVWRARGAEPTRLDDAERRILREVGARAGSIASALEPDAIEGLLSSCTDPEAPDSVWTVVHWIEQGGLFGLLPPRDGR